MLPDDLFLLLDHVCSPSPPASARDSLVFRQGAFLEWEGEIDAATERF